MPTLAPVITACTHSQKYREKIAKKINTSTNATTERKILTASKIGFMVLCDATEMQVEWIRQLVVDPTSLQSHFGKGSGTPPWYLGNAPGESEPALAHAGYHHKSIDSLYFCLQ
jgi:hypothetical protein